MFKRKTQVSVMLANIPGRFAEVCEKLYESEVDILAMSATPIGETGILRMVVDDPKKAVTSLEKQNISFLLTDVLVASVPNQPGMAAGLGHRFFQAGVNIEYTYFSGGEPGTTALMIFKVTDTDQALEILNRQPGAFN